MELRMQNQNLYSVSSNNEETKPRLYAAISEETRIKLVKSVIQKKMTLKKASQRFNVKYYTARAIVRNFKKSGIIHTPKTIKKMFRNTDIHHISQELNEYDDEYNDPEVLLESVDEEIPQTSQLTQSTRLNEENPLKNGCSDGFNDQNEMHNMPLESHIGQINHSSYQPTFNSMIYPLPFCAPTNIISPMNISQYLFWASYKFTNIHPNYPISNTLNNGFYAYHPISNYYHNYMCQLNSQKAYEIEKSQE